MVNKKNADIDYGNANVSYASNVKVSFSFAPQNIDYISDNIKFYISTNGGTTWSKELEIYSKNYYTFLFWDFSSPLTYDFSSTNIYTSTYDGNNSPDILYISDTNKKNKVEISIPNNVNKTNLRFKFEIENNDNDDYWFLDDIKITGDYIDTKTWNGTSWTGRTTSTPSNKDIIVINGNYNTKNNGNISACECTINANQTLSVNADTNITIQNNIINNGNIIVENDGNLIQINDNATFTGNPITVYRETNLKRLDYNYWSSPVENQNLQSFSPNTLSNRFYTYNESNDYFVTITPSTNNFVPAKGYAIRSPNNFGTSNSVFKGVFNGKVFVDKIAQKTNAYQQNNNILLNEGATIDTKPQLEIFADDVKCSHGCTVGQLNEDAMFYLRARGISKKEAQALLLYAFANDAMQNIDIEPLKLKISKLLAEKLEVDIAFEDLD